MNDKPTTDYYRARASEYEQIYFRHHEGRKQDLFEQGERLKELAKGKSVLEFACGTGYWTERMSVTAREIVAFDIWKEMLIEAKKKEYECPVYFVRADMDNLPFKEEMFDFVAIGFWISHQPRQELARFFEIIAKTLKPGGLIWMIDNNPPAEGPTNESVRVDQQGNNYKKRYLDDGREFIILKNYFTEKELRAVFERYFEIEELIYKPYYWRAVLKARRGAL